MDCSIEGKQIGMKAAKETIADNVHGIRRKVGSVGLVIFERDDILLRRAPRFADYTLGDIDTELLAVLRDMRELGVRFGFVWRRTTFRANRGVRFDGGRFTQLLDDLLRVSGASPDFWMETIHSEGPSQPQQWPGTSELDAILKLAEWYDVDPTKTVFVRKGESYHYSSATPAFTEILYPGSNPGGSPDSDRRASLVWLKTKIKHALKLP